MKVTDCMTSKVEIARPDMTLKDAAKKMKEGDFGVLPVADNDRLVGVITDRDIAIRAVADGMDPKTTQVRDVMSKKILYCYDDQHVDEVAINLGDNRIRRVPVLNRSKRLVGILSLGDLAQSDTAQLTGAFALISKPAARQHRETT